jgi:hypothetical protein
MGFSWEFKEVHILDVIIDDKPITDSVQILPISGFKAPLLKASYLK